MGDMSITKKILLYIENNLDKELSLKLAETKQPIVEIAFEAGYSSQQAFTRSFRCTYICTPQQYRRIGIFTPKQSRIHMGIRRQPVIFLFRPAGGRIAA